MSTQKSIEETGYTEQEESLWSSLWHDGYDADKENLIRTFRSIVQAERDRAEEEKRRERWRIWGALCDMAEPDERQPGAGDLNTHLDDVHKIIFAEALTNPQDNQ